MLPAFCKVQRLESRGQHPPTKHAVRKDTCRKLCRQQTTPPGVSQNWHISAKPTQKESPPVRLGGFPDRAAQVLSLLLYSPAQDGKHIKCFPLRAELATNLSHRQPGPGIRRARRGNATLQIGTGLFWSVYLGKRRAPALICSHLSHGNRRRLRKYIARFNRPFNAKWAVSPSRKRPQILRIDDGKGYFCFGLSC